MSRARSETRCKRSADTHYADPLKAPGLVDLTAHVDFQALAQAAEGMGARVHGPLSQAEFLRRLGIEQRAAALEAGAPEQYAIAIRAALERLTNEDRTGMGGLIKAIALSNPKLEFTARASRREESKSPLRRTPGLSGAAKAGHDNAMLQAASLAALPGIRHAFFTRDGGVSDGIYASLNGGPGSGDAPAKVAENRARMAAALGVDRLLTAYQIHSPDVVTIERPWDPQSVRAPTAS